MEKMFLNVCLFTTLAVLCSGSRSHENRRHRSRARHILRLDANYQRYPGIQGSRVSTTITTTETTLTPESSATEALVASSTTQSGTSSPDISTILSTTRRDNGYINARRRGSQLPESEYDQGSWDRSRQRMTTRPPSVLTTANGNRLDNGNGQNMYYSRFVNPHVRQNQENRGQVSEGQGQLQGQGRGQQQSQGQGQRQGQRQQQGHGHVGMDPQTGIGSPFYNKRTAFDYLSNHRNIGAVNSPNRQQHRELNRAMGEAMCEVFGKHYVPIAIGGTCQ